MQKPNPTKDQPIELTFNVTDWKTRNKIFIETEGTRAGYGDHRFVIHDLELISSFFVPLLTCSGKIVFHHYYLYIYLILS